MSFVCMYFVCDLFLKTEKKKKIKSWLLIEGFEHLVFPVILVGIVIFTNSKLTAILFHTALILFFYLFIGKIVIKAKSKEDWLRVISVMSFTYFFIFLYPEIMIVIQMNTSIKGYWILIGTVPVFYLMNRFLKIDSSLENNQLYTR